MTHYGYYNRQALRVFAIFCLMTALTLTGCTAPAPAPQAVPESAPADVPAVPADAPLPDVTEIYPVAACFEPSGTFRATLDGETLPVVRCHDEYDACFFAFRGAVTLEIDAGEPVTRFSVSPLAKEIPAQAAGTKLTIPLTQPEYLIVKINDLRELVIAADPPETDAPDPSGEGVRNVLALGADPTGRTSATAVIQSAVDGASAAGGGTVFVPAGVYAIGNLKLKSNVHLYLAPGAVLRADCPEEFTAFCTRTVNNTAYPATYLLTTEPNSENVSVTGRGTVDCRGYSYFQQKSWLVCGFVPNRCDGLTLDGVTVLDTGHWGTIVTYCRDVTITNTKHLNKPTTLGQNDAIDVVGSQNVTVRRTLAIARDDPYSIKTYVSNAMFEGVGRAAEDLLFEDCFAWTRCAAFKLGWGVEMGMKNVVFRDSYAYKCNLGIAVTHYGGSASITDVTFERIDLEQFQLADSVWLLAAVDTSKPGGNRTSWGAIRGLTVRDVNVRARWSGECRLAGHDKNAPLSGVTISGVTILGRPAATLSDMGVTANEFVTGLTLGG